ncbi:MAG: tetratricopeptide repeat protein [Pseudomonadota bacterium]
MHINFQSGKRLLALGILCLGLLTLAGCSNEDAGGRSIESYLNSASSFIDQRQYRAALIELRNAAGLDANDSRLKVLEARVNVDLGNFREAYLALERVPNRDLEATGLLAEAYLRSGKFASTLLLMRQSETVFADQPVTKHILTGRAYVGLGELDKARASFDAALLLDPGNLDARLGLVSILAARGDLVTAEDRLEEILEVAPDKVNALLLLNAIYIAQGRLQDAEDSLTRTVSALPNSDIFTYERAGVLRSLISLLARQGRSGEALVYQQALEEAFPNAQENNEKYAQALSDIRNGQYESAEKLLQDLYSQSPGHETGGALLGILNFLRGRDEDAQRYFSEAVDIETARLPLLKAIAMNLYRLNQPEKVVETLEGRIASTSDTQILAVYGVAAIAANQASKGEAALRKAIDLDPANVRLRLVLAQYLRQAQPPRMEETLTLLTDGEKLAPESVELKVAILEQLTIMGRQQTAETYLADWLASGKSRLEATLTAGAYRLSRDELDQASTHYRTAIELAPDSEVAKSGLAEVLVRQARHESAREIYRELIQANKDNRTALFGMLNAWALDGDIGAGIAEVEKLTADSEIAALVISRFLTRTNRLDEADKFVTKLARADEDSVATKRLTAEIGLRRAQIAIAQKDYERARTSAFSALAVYPLNRELLRMLAKIELEAGQLKEAEKVLDVIRNNHPNSLLVPELSGDLALARGDLQTAVDFYEVVWESAPDDGLAARMVTALRNLGDLERAASLIAEWRERRPSSALAAILDVELFPRNYDRGIQIYQQYLDSNRDNAAILNNLAWLYLEKGVPKLGLDAAERAFELFPDNGSVLDTYGWLLYNTGDTGRAVSLLERASRLMPEDKTIQERLKIARGDS